VVCYSVFGYTWAQITISSNSVMARLAVKGKEGKIMGMYNFMASLGLITGNIISGIIVDTMGFTAEFLLGFTVIILSIFWMRKIKNKEDSEMKIKVKTAFEKTMLERKKWWNLFTYQKIDSYLEMAGVQKGWNALDVAAGDGIVAYRLAKKGCTVTAMDISPALLFHRSTNHTDYIVEDAEKMDYKKEFDIITCRNAFHYFPNPLLVLQKMRNALKPGGVLLLMEPIATTETYPFLKRLFEKKAPVRNFFTKEELVDMIVSEDFVVVTTLVDEYTNWVKTDTDIKTSVTTLLKDGVLYFTMDDGYLVLVAKKRLKIIL
jgi:ubiquinone/menaquinone biosynthesis C-methylase UbiE